MPTKNPTPKTNTQKNDIKVILKFKIPANNQETLNNAENK